VLGPLTAYTDPSSRSLPDDPIGSTSVKDFGAAQRPHGYERQEDLASHALERESAALLGASSSQATDGFVDAFPPRAVSPSSSLPDRIFTILPMSNGSFCRPREGITAEPFQSTRDRAQ